MLNYDRKIFWLLGARSFHLKVRLIYSSGLRTTFKQRPMENQWSKYDYYLIFYENLLCKLWTLCSLGDRIVAFILRIAMESFGINGIPKRTENAAENLKMLSIERKWVPPGSIYCRLRYVVAIKFAVHRQCTSSCMCVREAIMNLCKQFTRWKCGSRHRASVRYTFTYTVLIALLRLTSPPSYFPFEPCVLWKVCAIVLNAIEKMLLTFTLQRKYEWNTAYAIDFHNFGRTSRNNHGRVSSTEHCSLDFELQRENNFQWISMK